LQVNTETFKLDFHRESCICAVGKHFDRTTLLRPSDCERKADESLITEWIGETQPRPIKDLPSYEDCVWRGTWFWTTFHVSRTQM